MSIVSETATLAYGYTMADINGMALHAGRVHRSGLVDEDERLAVAWHGIVVALYEARTEPTRYELVGAGVHALSREADRLRSHYGLQYRGYEGTGPNFNKYWGVRHHDNDDGFTERIVERLALPTVLAILTPKQYEVISTLAAFDGDIHAASIALGVTESALEQRAGRARRRIAAAWFGDETPRRTSRVDGMCLNGHSRTEHATQDPNGQWRCRTCQKGNSRRWARRHRERKRAEAAQ